MFRRQLVSHITVELEKGKKSDEILASLMADGWSEADVKQAFHYSMFPSELRMFSVRRFLSGEMPAWVEVVSVFVAVLFVVGAGITFAYYREPTYNYELQAQTLPLSQKSELRYGAEPALSEPDFFASVARRFIAEKVNFISANLDTMKLSLYKEGVLFKEVPILTKGKEGAWWETPAGLYKIESKERNHFSSFGQVYQPWSLAFQGNFFIHGWPHYVDGTPVVSSYSGGCIRLSDEDAEAIFSESRVGMPVLVFEKDFKPDGKTFSARTPSLSATEYLVADSGSNFVFFEKDSRRVVPIASITKLVTALVATEYINLDSKIVIKDSMVIKTSKARLTAGDSVTAYQLLFPLLLESSNEAAEAIAQFAGRNRFISLMNEKAVAIGMKNTRFVDPSGREDGNVSTAEDLFALAKYISNNRSFIFNVASGKLTHSAYGSVQFKNLSNFNDFAGVAEFFGGKVGQTTVAGETALYVFKIPLGGEERTVVFIALHSTDRKNDAERMLQYVKSNFE